MTPASRNSTPLRAPRPLATMIEIGVARPSAHGQAMISTDTAASSVSPPTFSARIVSAPSWLTVPPVSASPSTLAAGSGSPVSIASSTWLPPASTTPSTGTFCPSRS